MAVCLIYYERNLNYLLDIANNKRFLKKVKNKYFIDNRSVEEVVDDLMIMVQKITAKAL